MDISHFTSPSKLTAIKKECKRYIDDAHIQRNRGTGQSSSHKPWSVQAKYCEVWRKTTAETESEPIPSYTPTVENNSIGINVTVLRDVPNNLRMWNLRTSATKNRGNVLKSSSLVPQNVGEGRAEREIMFKWHIHCRGSVAPVRWVQAGGKVMMSGRQPRGTATSLMGLMEHQPPAVPKCEGGQALQQRE